jgi:hypothetical protein
LNDLDHDKRVLTGGFELVTDFEIGATYLTIKEDAGQVFTVIHSETVNIDYDYDSALVGIELLDLQNGFPVQDLASEGSDLHKALTEANTYLTNH